MFFQEFQPIQGNLHSHKFSQELPVNTNSKVWFFFHSCFSGYLNIAYSQNASKMQCVHRALHYMQKWLLKISLSRKTKVSATPTACALRECNSWWTHSLIASKNIIKKSLKHFFAGISQHSCCRVVLFWVHSQQRPRSILLSLEFPWQWETTEETNVLLVTYSLILSSLSPVMVVEVAMVEGQVLLHKRHTNGAVWTHASTRFHSLLFGLPATHTTHSTNREWLQSTE